MTNKQGSVFTDIQEKELKGLLDRKAGFMAGEDKALTPKMQARVEQLLEKKNAPFELSDTAKTMIYEAWLEKKKGIRNYITSKYMEKGKWMESDGIDLTSKIDDIFYTKNVERKTDNFFTGECDVIHDDGNGRTVHDIKCVWNAQTFGKAEFTSEYEWQGRVYMHLWDADRFRLRYCLIDAPFHIYEYEEHRFKLNKGIIDPDLEESRREIENFERTLMFSQNPTISPEECVKSFTIERDDKKFEEIMDRIPAAIEYYESLRLNIGGDEFPIKTKENGE